MAPWRGSVTYSTQRTTHNLPCWPDSKAQPSATCSEKCIPHSARYTEISFSPSPPSTVSQRTLYTSSTQSAGARLQKQRQCLFTRTHVHTNIIKYQPNVYSTHECPSVLEASCSHPKACTLCAHVGQECSLANTPLPWQCLSRESADPCFMAAGSTQNTYTARPLSPEDETMLQTLHDKWGLPPIQSLFRSTEHKT